MIFTRGGSGLKREASALKKQNTEHDVNSVKNVTRRILALDGNAVRLSLATLICILVGITAIMVPLVPTMLFASEEDAMFAVVSSMSGIFLLGLLFLVFVPCVSGFMFFAKKTVDGDRPRFVEMLAPFTGKVSYGSTLLMPLLLVFRVAVIVLPFVGGLMNLPFGAEIASMMTPIELMCDASFILCLSILASGVGAYFSSFFFFVPYIVISDRAGFFKAISLSFRMSSKRNFEIMGQMLINFARTLLAALSFMIAWLFYGAPRITVSYFVYCDRVFGVVTPADYE